MANYNCDQGQVLPGLGIGEALLHFAHNYNHVSRAAMYRWFNHHLHLGLEGPIMERDFRRLAPQEMTVWESEGPHRRPPGVRHPRALPRRCG